METEISQLEQRVEQLVSLYEGVKAENHRLRDRLAAVENDSRALSQKFDAALQRIESLIESLPEN